VEYIKKNKDSDKKNDGKKNDSKIKKDKEFSGPPPFLRQSSEFQNYSANVYNRLKSVARNSVQSSSLVRIISSAEYPLLNFPKSTLSSKSLVRGGSRSSNLILDSPVRAPRSSSKNNTPKSSSDDDYNTITNENGNNKDDNHNTTSNKNNDNEFRKYSVDSLVSKISNSSIDSRDYLKRENTNKNGNHIGNINFSNDIDIIQNPDTVNSTYSENDSDDTALRNRYKSSSSDNITNMRFISSTGLKFNTDRNSYHDSNSNTNPESSSSREEFSAELLDPSSTTITNSKYDTIKEGWGYNTSNPYPDSNSDSNIFKNKGKPHHYNRDATASNSESYRLKSLKIPIIHDQNHENQRNLVFPSISDSEVRDRTISIGSTRSLLSDSSRDSNDTTDSRNNFHSGSLDANDVTPRSTLSEQEGLGAGIAPFRSVLTVLLRHAANSQLSNIFQGIIRYNHRVVEKFADLRICL
jgi:hypothetical protein